MKTAVLVGLWAAGASAAAVVRGLDQKQGQVQQDQKQDQRQDQNQVQNANQPQPQPQNKNQNDAQNGFLIDHSLPDGHYNIHLKEDGNHVVRRWTPDQNKWHRMEKRAGTGQYTFLVDDDTNRVEAVSLDIFPEQRLPLPPMTVSCGHYFDYNTLKYPLIQDDYRASKRALFNYCQNYPFTEGHVAMALNGSVAAYVCQCKVTVLNENRCSEAEYRAVEAVLNQTCGESAGWGYMPKWNKEYGRNWKGEKICGQWGRLPPLQYPGPTFDPAPGEGQPLLEEQMPKEERPLKSKEDFLRETVFEPLPDGNAGDDGARHNHVYMYGPYLGDSRDYDKLVPHPIEDPPASGDALLPGGGRDPMARPEGQPGAVRGGEVESGERGVEEAEEGRALEEAEEEEEERERGA